MSCMPLPFPPPSIIFYTSNANNKIRYDLKQMLIKSPISRLPEELRKHEAAQSKPNRMARKTEDNSSFGGSGHGGKSGW